MKKIILCISVAITFAILLCGCSDTSGQNDKIKIVCTTFPQYDWVKNIIGVNSDTIEVKLLLNSGVDLHSYQPSADDIAVISGCDMFIYVGGESDEWAEEALKKNDNTARVAVNMLNALGDAAREELVVEGMESEAEDEHDHEGEEPEESEESEENQDDSAEEEKEYDEHVWLSLKNAETLCKHISEELCELDAENAALYRENSDKYIAQLDALDKEYGKAAESASCKTILFGDRFPFRYIADDYALEYYAAFAGCSAETEASFETISFLSNKIDELGLENIFVLEGSDQKIAETIRDNTNDKNQDIIVLDSMQSVTDADIEEGTTYLSVMSDNLNALKKGIE